MSSLKRKTRNKPGCRNCEYYLKENHYGGSCTLYPMQVVEFNKAVKDTVYPRVKPYHFCDSFKYAKVNEWGEISPTVKNKILQWREDFPALMHYLREIWVFPHFGWVHNDGSDYELHTAGHMINEELIEILQQHKLFWERCWMRSERGGHYYFMVEK